MLAALTSSALLSVWEEGIGRQPLDRTLLILQAADPARADLASLPVAECDRLLLCLRQATFGDRMTSLANCPDCGLSQEFELSAAELLSAYHQNAGWEKTIEVQGYRVRLRPLLCRDLSEAAGCKGIEEASRLLMSRAIAQANSPQGEVIIPELPDAVWQAVEQELSEREREVTLDIVCHQCGHCWAPLFDIGSYLWDELESEARRLLIDVAALASRYGWSEADILSMSPFRRHAYLNLEGSG